MENDAIQNEDENDSLLTRGRLISAFGKLNLPNEYVKIGTDYLPYYKCFSGRDIDHLPRLLTQGRVPLSVAHILKRRLEIRNYPTEVKTRWRLGSETSDLKAQRGE
jgi:hypothetical protein